VPKALDPILAKALAKDKAHRYGSARALAKDLTEFLYKQGKPVSAFEVADLVQGAMRLRQTTAPEKGSLIESLIAEALFEFRSLEDEGDEKSTAGHLTEHDQPIKIGGFDDIGSWADEIAAGGAKRTGDDVMRMTLPGVALDALGNLAALEDEPSSPELGRSSPVPTSPRGVAAPVGPRSSGIGPIPAADGSALANVGSSAGDKWAQPPAPDAKGGGGALKAIVVLAVLAVAAAGAWFGGLIPR
jgi:hypothetical protein